MDISPFPCPVRRLQTKVETEIRRRSDTAGKDLLKRMQKLCRRTRHEPHRRDRRPGSPKGRPAPKKAAVAKPAAKKAKPASVIKFRHPENAAIGWTGHGRKPRG